MYYGMVLEYSIHDRIDRGVFSEHSLYRTMPKYTVEDVRGNQGELLRSDITIVTDRMRGLWHHMEQEIRVE